MKPVAEDDLEPLITECPSCRTRFRVAEAQLQSARGRVRCGACLTVFNGVEHLIWDEVEIYSSDEEAQSALDDLLNELEETVRQSDVHAAGGEPHPSGSAGIEPGEEDAEDVAAPSVEAEAETVIELIEEPLPQRKQEAEDDRPSQGPRNVVPIFSGFEEDEQPTETVEQEALEAHEVQEQVADLPETMDTGSAEGTAQDSTAAVRAPTEAAQGLPPADVAEIEPEPAPPAERPAAKPGATPAETKDTPRQAQDDDAVPMPSDAEVAAAAPVVFGEPSRRRPWMWLAITAAVAGIVLQVFWYQFEVWAKDPTWRPVYASFCNLAGCELPVQSDLSLLRTKNLLVRSDPDDPGVLLVNAVIVNEAQFAQPFPVLELRFTDLRGALVAGRRFQPQEYLAGEGAGMELMPARTPVQIELGIEDPGPEAVNYTMKIR